MSRGSRPDDAGYPDGHVGSARTVPRSGQVLCGWSVLGAKLSKDLGVATDPFAYCEEVESRCLHAWNEW